MSRFLGGAAYVEHIEVDRRGELYKLVRVHYGHAPMYARMATRGDTLLATYVIDDENHFALVCRLIERGADPKVPRPTGQTLVDVGLGSVVDDGVFGGGGGGGGDCGDSAGVYGHWSAGRGGFVGRAAAERASTELVEVRGYAALRGRVARGMMLFGRTKKGA